MRKIKNWLGENMEFSGTIGQAIANHQIKNLPGGYIYDDGFINLSADPEIPIKGFIILGISKPIYSITQFSKEERTRIIEVSNKLLEVLHEIGFSKVIQFQDESTWQFHIWFLPRHEWTYQYGNDLTKISNFAKNQLNTSDKYKKELLDCIELLKEKFS